MKHNKLPVRFTGQHFTTDAALIKYIIELAEIQPGDLVFDLGGGKGHITDQLSQKTRHITVIEKDDALAKHLQQKYQSAQGLKVIHTDMLKYTFPDAPFKVVSNIPYSLTSHILRKLMYTNVSNFQGGSIITQLEPALKMISQSSYNPYSICYKTFYEISLVKQVHATSFNPPPTVKSALIHIQKRRQHIVPIEFIAAYLRFLFYLLKKPDINTLTALKKVFRKRQVRLFAEKYSIELEKSIIHLSVKQWANCFMEMQKRVPQVCHP